MTPAGPSTRARVLVVEDGRTPYVLAAVRALGRAGFDVGLGSAEGGRASRSRWVGAVHSVPGPERGVEEFAAAVADAVRDGGYDLAFGGDDAEMLALSAVRECLPCLIPHAPHEVVLRAVDKLELARAAERCGLRTPHTVAATTRAIAETPLPVIVKSRLHWTPGRAAGIRHLLVSRCDDRAGVERGVAEMAAAGGEAVLQEPIDGELMALSAVIDESGNALAWAQQRTLRASLRRTSARAETVTLDQDLARRAATLLGDLGWYGLANLQFLRPAGGEPKLIDLNGRFYGSIALAIAAGVNLPAIWADLALGRPPPEPVLARPGARFQGLLTDLRRARRERRGGLLRDVLDTAVYAPRAAHSCLSVRDPRPVAYELRRLAHELR